jgi:hypothetical protein
MSSSSQDNVSSPSTTASGNAGAPIPVTVSENYLQERVIWNILAQLNPNTATATETRTTDLPYFIYNPLMQNEEEFKKSQQQSKQSQKKRRVPMKPKTDTYLKQTTKSKQKKTTDKARDKLTIDQQIELDIEKEIKRLQNLDIQSDTESPSTVFRAPSPFREEKRSKSPATSLYRPGSRSDSRQKQKRSASAKDAFVFTNPNNVYIPSEYDLILFEDDADDEEYNEREYITSRSSRYQNYRIQRDVYKPKPSQVKSESKDTMKKILLKQFELTSALHTQLTELNKKKVKKRSKSAAQ